MTGPESRPVSLAAVGRSTMILTGGAVIVQIIGFARQLFLAAEVGISSPLDAFLIALAAPLALLGVLTAGLQTALVPAYVEIRQERGPTDARRLVGNVLVWIALAGAVASLALWLMAAPIVAITGPGLAEAGTADDAVRYLHILAPMGVLLAVSSIYYALCQAESLFPAIATANVAGSLLTVGIMVYFWDTMGLDGLVLGTLAGAVFSLAIIVFATALRRVTPALGFRSRGLGMRDLLRHAVPLSAGAAILEVNLVVDRAVASWLVPGGVSALRYGESIIRIPFAAISPAWGQAVYPELVRAGRLSGQTGLAGTTERLLRYALVFFVPLAGLTLAVAPVAVAAAFDRGSFTSADLLLTSGVVAVSAPLIVTWVVAPTLVSALNARRMGTVMMVASVINVTLNVVLTLALGYLFGVVGVALSTTIVSVVMVAFFARRLAQVETAFTPRILGRTLVRATLAILPSALAFGIPIWAGAFQGSLAERVAVLAVVGVAGLSSYYAIARRLGLDEVDALRAFGMDILRRLFGRMRTGPGGRHHD